MPAENLNFGLDAELKAKRDAKYDVALEGDVVRWVEAVLGDEKGDQSVAEWLRSGVVLCTLVNTFKPGIVRSINKQTMPFKQMENIKNFLNAARELGVPESSMFGTPDLYEEKNMGSVMLCLYTLGGAVQTAFPDYKGPKLGVPINAKSKDTSRSFGAATQMGGFHGTQEVERPTARGDYIVKHLGMKEGGSGTVTPARSVSQRPSETASPELVTHAASPAKAGLPARTPPPKMSAAAKVATPSPVASPPAAAPPGAPDGEDVAYGLDKELKAKQEARYDVGLEGEVVQWVEAITGQAHRDQSIAEWLKSGIVLCVLVNKIRPGSIKKINESSMPFKQMENITFFTHAARALGVPENAMFATPDLFEAKNMGSVMLCLYAFGGAVQTSCPEFRGPRLGLAVKAGTKADVRRSKVMATQGGGLAGTLEQERPHERADYCVKPVDRA